MARRLGSRQSRATGLCQQTNLGARPGKPTWSAADQSPRPVANDQAGPGHLNFAASTGRKRRVSLRSADHLERVMSVAIAQGNAMTDAIDFPMTVAWSGLVASRFA
jgi:hypothetical protein